MDVNYTMDEITKYVEETEKTIKELKEKLRNATNENIELVDLAGDLKQITEKMKFVIFLSDWDICEKDDLITAMQIFKGFVFEAVEALKGYAKE